MPEKTASVKKRKYGFMLQADVNQMIEDHKYLKNDDRSAFVAEAIRRYSAELDGERNLDVLCDRMYKIVSAEVDCQSNRMANILFKIAVELAILNYKAEQNFSSDEETEVIINEKGEIVGERLRTDLPR
jgi:hypothetical protein